MREWQLSSEWYISTVEQVLLVFFQFFRTSYIHRLKQTKRYMLTFLRSEHETGGMGEICAQGFRNPYRCSFDRKNDDLYCGDVGNFEVESVKKVE